MGGCSLKMDVINEEKNESPLLECTIYGDRESFAKISKRIACALSGVPLRIKLYFISDIMKAMEAGARKNPAIFYKDKLLFEGYLNTEEIIDIFKEFL